MTRITRTILIAIGTIALTQAYAQQPADADKTATAPAAPAAAPAPAPAAGPDSAAAAPTPPAAQAAAPTATQAAAAPAGASAETIKKARQAGYHQEVRKGVTLFCHEDATIGTHFTSKKCVDESGLAAVLDLRQQQREQMDKPVACGAGCSGH
ncbi:MAG: hypothetical protein ACLPTF_03630 [Steroidobacteraceae bacterium]